MKFFLIVLCLFFFSGCKHQEEKQVQLHDFEALMGKGLEQWARVQTKADHDHLAFYKAIYDKNRDALETAPDANLGANKIPPVIHFIWMGPKPFPAESIENVRLWRLHHPGWTMKFWTDRARELPHPEMELCRIQEFPFSKVGALFARSENYAEKSDLLRYEILLREGGVYADHDVKCLHSFSALHLAYDFYAGLEMPRPTPLSSCIVLTNNVVGARPGHVILEAMLDWLVASWDQIENTYPGKDRDAVIERIAHRTFFVIGEMFQKHANEGSNVDIALPALYFNAPSEALALYSHHQYAGTWFENESVFEKNVRKRLMGLSKKANQMLLAISILAGMMVIGFLALGVVLARALKKGRPSEKASTFLENR